MKRRIGLKKWAIVLFCGFLISFFLPSKLTRPPPTGLFVAKIGDRLIDVSEFKNAMQRSESNIGEETFDDPLRFSNWKKKILEELIVEEKLVLEAERAQTEISDEEVEREIIRLKSMYPEHLFRKKLESLGLNPSSFFKLKKKRLLIDRFLGEKALSDLTVSDQELRDWYEQHPAEFTQPESFEIEQIFLISKEEAEAVHERLKKGEDFSKLAHTLSQSADRKQNGRILYVTRENFLDAFESCQKIGLKTLSEVVKSPQGFHIFRCLKKQEARKISLDAVSARIRQWLLEKKREEAFEKLKQDLQKQGPVWINEKLLEEIQNDAQKNKSRSKP